MKKKNLLLGAAAALCLSLPAQALPDGWYVSLEGGANWVQDWDLTSVNGITKTPRTVSYDLGWAALASVGYDFGRWSTEFETGYRHNDFDSITPPSFGRANYHDISLDETSFMGNLKYTYPVTEKLTLSLGGGIGADHARLQVARAGANTEDQDWMFAYQGIASVGYAVGQQSEVYIAYRYFRTNSAQFDFQPVLGETWQGDDFQKHTATIGFRYYLNGAAPAEPMAAPPPPEAGKPTEYIIFFGHNKSDLTTAAMTVVKEAAAAAKADGVANIRLVGHTDRSGSDGYNQALSLRRAKATKAALVSEGVADGVIAMEAKGESEPLVPTADGVREPQNRRVNINF